MNFGKVWACSYINMPADRQTNMKTETFITILHISGSEEVAAVQAAKGCIATAT